MNKSLVASCMALFVFVAFLASSGKKASPRFLELENLSFAQMQQLDRSHTVVLMTIGVLEEHGPHLPVSVDTIHAEAITKGVIQTINRELPGWTVVRFPLIPLGVRGTNVLGAKPEYMGSFTVRPAVLRDVLVDLGTMMAEQGFENILVIYAHGNPMHSRMVGEACEFVRVSTGAHMWNLTGMALADWRRPIDLATARCLTVEQRKMQGMDIHGGLMETSITLFLRPDLVDPGYQKLRPIPASNFLEIMQQGEKPDWPGYWSYPNWATTKCGELHVEARTGQVASLALRALKGEDLSGAPIYPTTGMPPLEPLTAAAFAKVERIAEQYERARETKLEAWLKIRPVPQD